jgi:hypothetical protein
LSVEDLFFSTTPSPSIVERDESAPPGVRSSLPGVSGADDEAGPRDPRTSLEPRAAAAPRRGWRLGLFVPAVSVLATAAGLAVGLKVSAARQAAPMASISFEVDSLRAAGDLERTELKRQASALTETRQAIDDVARRQVEAEEAAKVDHARIEAEQARLAREVLATRRAQARTDEHVYQLSEAMKLIDWATTGGNSMKAIEAVDKRSYK